MAFAPHSVAACTIGIALATLGWLFRIAITRRIGLRRSEFDLIIILSLLWTVLSAVFSEEPSISIAKLQASWVVLVFYLTRAIVSRKTAFLLVATLVLSGTVGVVYSAFDLVRGRGVTIESVSPASPFQRLQIQPGDTIWALNRSRVYSVSEIDAELKKAVPGQALSVSLISRGEHVERPGLIVTNAQSDSPSGLTGNTRSHRFRASGWTRHYQTFAEVLQIISLLALGIALAHFRNHGLNKYAKLALLAATILAVGVVFTAMRTVLVAFAIGASLIAWRSLRGVPKVVFVAVLFLVIGFGAAVVWQTRANSALLLGDDSSNLRLQVARVGLQRIWVNPVFGHGMDSMHLHWNEWGFPGKDILHLHSTPLQLAFDRGLPMLLLWLWMMAAFWRHLSRAVKKASELSDTNSYGILLGALGALTAFLASSLVNYNYGDSEVAMIFWWLMGTSVAIGKSEEESVNL